MSNAPVSDRPDAPTMWLLSYAASVALMVFARSLHAGTPIRIDVADVLDDAKRIADEGTKEALKKWDKPPAYFKPPK